MKAKRAIFSSDTNWMNDIDKALLFVTSLGQDRVISVIEKGIDVIVVWYWEADEAK